jgi:hypothetical protein
MKKLLLAGVAALLLAIGAAHTADWQCGPHYVNTFVLHTQRPGLQPIIAYPFYNRTLAEVIKNNLPSGGDDEIGLSKAFVGAMRPIQNRGQRVLTYRGKPCFQYFVPSLPRPRPSETP